MSSNDHLGWVGELLGFTIGADLSMDLEQTPETFNIPFDYPEMVGHE